MNYTHTLHTQICAHTHIMTLWTASNQTHKNTIIHFDTDIHTHSGTIRQPYKYMSQWKGYYKISIHMLIRYQRHLQCRQQADTLFLYISACLQLSVSHPSVCISLSLSVSLPSGPFYFTSSASISVVSYRSPLQVKLHSEMVLFEDACVCVCLCVYFVRETINFVPFYSRGAFTGWHYGVKRVGRAWHYTEYNAAKSSMQTSVLCALYEKNL